MLKPTQDLKLQIDLASLICSECTNIACINNPQITTHKFFNFMDLCGNGKKTLTSQLEIIEKRGYHNNNGEPEC